MMNGKAVGKHMRMAAIIARGAVAGSRVRKVSAVTFGAKGMRWKRSKTHLLLLDPLILLTDARQHPFR
jgi:hypothetical protein